MAGRGIIVTKTFKTMKKTILALCAAMALMVGCGDKSQTSGTNGEETTNTQNMKKIMIIDGGPRKNFNTASMLQKFAEGASSVSDQIEVKTVRLYDMDYKGCMSCMACKVKGKASNVCKYRDELTPVLEEIAEADGLVLGSPIYFGDVTGQMRTFLERLAFPWLSYNDYSLTAPKRMPVGLM